MAEGTPRDGSMSGAALSDFEELVRASFGDVFPRPVDGASSEENRMNDSESDRRARLSAVPQPGTPDQRAPVLRWVLTLSEPLLSPKAREQVEADMVAFIARNGQWSANWFAGFMSDLLHTLPPTDPWRRLSAFIDLGDISGGSSTDPDRRLSFHNREGAPPQHHTGATRPDGTPFGSINDALDLVASELGPPENDMALIAIAEQVDPVTAAIVGFSAGQVELSAAVLSKVRHHLWLANFEEGELVAAEAFLDVAGTALRWILHRRRCYTGLDDPFPTIAGGAWMSRADRVTAGGRSIASEPSLARDAQIDPGAYEQLRVDF